MGHPVFVFSEFLMVVLFLVSLVVASLVSSVGVAGFVSGLLSFALLVGFLVLVVFVGGCLVFGVPGGSFSGELRGESVEFGAVGLVSCARGCAGCAAGSGLVQSAAELGAGCSLVLGRSGRRLGGAALAGRVRSLVAGGELVFA
jgi:hypothetical protein